MKKIIVFTVVNILCSSLLFGNNKQADLNASAFTDSIPKNIDSAYAQKKIAYHRDTAITPHFDTLTSNPVYQQIDSANASKATKDSTSVQKKRSSSKKKRNN
jgi:hypothetical protein